MLLLLILMITKPFKYFPSVCRIFFLIETDNTNSITNSITYLAKNYRYENTKYSSSFLIQQTQLEGIIAPKK